MPLRKLGVLIRIFLFVAIPFAAWSQIVDNSAENDSPVQPEPVEANNLIDESKETIEANIVENQAQITHTQIENKIILTGDTPEILSKEDQIRIKQTDEAIDKSIPRLKAAEERVFSIINQYENELKNIADNRKISEEILSKYKPLIEQMLSEMSVLVVKSKSEKIGNRTPEMATKQAQKLRNILTEIKALIEPADNQLEQISRAKIDQILEEIKNAVAQEITEETPTPDNQPIFEEQISKSVEIIKELSSVIDKTIIKDQYVLNYLEQKREDKRKLVWLQAVKKFNECIADARQAVEDANTALRPLESENVEHLKTRIMKRAVMLRKKIARIIWQYAEKSFAEKRFNEAKDNWENARKIFADISLDIIRFQEKLNIKSSQLEKMKNNCEKEIEIIFTKEEKCEKELAAIDFVEKTSMKNIDTGRDLRLNDINVNLAQAEIYIKNEEYMKARDALETVLMRDPYNIKATRILKNLYEKIFDAARVRRFNEYLETLTINEWNWNEAVLPRPADKPPVELITKQADRSSIASKLNDIIIPRIEFEDTSLNAVVQYLIAESKENDTSPEKTGVPILLQLNPDQISQIPQITISLDDTPIGEIIRYVCQSTGLKYRVEDRAVIISTEITTVMETRFFKVRASTVNAIAPSAQDENTDMMRQDADLVDLTTTFQTDTGTGTARPSNVTSEQLKAYFTERGVPFINEDSTIAYDRRSGKLIVKNTPENLRRLETLLREIDIETPLVLIEAKFVELTQTDLEELGFEYLFSKDPNVPVADQLDTSSWWQVTQNASTMRTLGINASGLTSPVNPGVNSRLINNLQLPAGFGPGSNGGRYNFSFYLHALNRSQQAEVLSAPKVIATSGSEAIIRMIRQEYFPESWTEPEVTVTENVFRVIPSIPEFGEATDLGIRFSVTPTVSPNNYTITLNIWPQVVEFTGWTDYSYDLAVGPSNNRATLIMPEFSRRDVRANVKVYDGETLIIGGMIRDDTASVDDRIPGFGDLPLLGRLARTTNEQKIKRNLIIFITARLVNPDGIPIRAGEIRGSFDFRR